MTYRHFEHTADLGLRVEASDLDALFGDAAAGLFAMIAEVIEPHASERRVDLRVEGRRKDYLLFDWLNELLFRFDTERLLMRDFNVRVGSAGLEASAAAQPADPRRHRLLHEVKAITYHGLSVETFDGGWCAEVIVDI